MEYKAIVYPYNVGCTFGERWTVRPAEGTPGTLPGKPWEVFQIPYGMKSAAEAVQWAEAHGFTVARIER